MLMFGRLLLWEETCSCFCSSVISLAIAGSHVSYYVVDRFHKNDQELRDYVKWKSQSKQLKISGQSKKDNKQP